ncbi:MAG: NAD-dependent epimerase/dehydratase family protein, partial [Bacteroidota bacterium]
MNILITGGAGFVGSNLTEILLKDGHQVVVYDNFSYGKKSLLPVSDNLIVIEGDILDVKALRIAFENFKPELVFHLAAIHHIPTCENNPALAIRTNIEGSQNVIEAAIMQKSRKIVFASSGAVYEIVDVPLIEDETPVVPYDIYSITKLAGEHLMRLQAERGNIIAVACRLFNTVGRHETNEHLVPDILKQVKSGSNEIKLGNLTPLRSYIHVSDVADGFYSAGLTDLPNVFDTLNIGTETENSVLDIMNLISEISGHELKVFQDQTKVRKV